MTVRPRPTIFVLAVLALVTSRAAAALTLGTPFADHMVVQRDRPLVLWGRADANATVAVDFAAEHATAHADADGHWQVTVKPPAVGGPYAARVTTGADAVALADVLCGDVWLCAGQSNMQLGVGEDTAAPRLRATAKSLPTVRLLPIPKAAGKAPEYSIKATWHPADSAALDHFSAVAFHFGLTLAADPKLRGVPIGLIDSSFGGTAAEGWTPAAALSAVAPADVSPSMFGLPPGGLFNHMIAPLGPLSLTGVVWYQGENNSPHPAVYPTIMTQLIGAWRAQFRTPELPFVIVQLPPFTDLYNGHPFTWVRESQGQVVRAVPHTALVVTLDTTDGFDLHPPDKGQVGRRAALQARRLAYGEDVVADGPTMAAAAVAGDAVRVTFDTHGGGPLAARGGGDAVRGFALAAADGAYHTADATLAAPDAILVRCPDVPAPATVRYAWAAAPDATLTDAAGLPAGPFRTDRQPPAVPIEVVPVITARHVATPRYDAVIDGNGNLASLGVAKRQFVSNDFDGPGVANFAAMFGPRPLQRRTDLTPATVRFADASLSITYAFADDALTVTIQNRAAKDKVPYHLRLAAGVRVTADGGGGFTLRRGKATVHLTGADRAADDGPAGGTVGGTAGGAVDLAVDGSASRTLVFRCDAAD